MNGPPEHVILRIHSRLAQGLKPHDVAEDLRPGLDRQMISALKDSLNIRFITMQYQDKTAQQYAAVCAAI